jgi:hypothetical protein
MLPDARFITSSNETWGWGMNACAVCTKFSIYMLLLIFLSCRVSAASETTLKL